MTIKIPTTVFAQKVIFQQRRIPLTARTQTQAIILSEDDELFDHLKYNGQLRKYAKARRTLTEWIHFEVGASVMRQVGKDVYAIGLYLDKSLKRELCKNVEARAQSATEKVTSIRDFFQYHRIEEDDYSQEAAIKRVQRHYLRKSAAKTAMISLHGGGQSLRFWQYDDKELEIIYQTYRCQYPIYFFTTKQTERLKLPQQCRMWIWKHIGNRTPQYIAQKFKVDTSTVWRNIQAFDGEFTRRPKPQPLSVLLEAVRE